MAAAVGVTDCKLLIAVAETTLFDALADSNLELHAVGDCVAPRWAVHAIYEGRKLGLSL